MTAVPIPERLADAAERLISELEDLDPIDRLNIGQEINKALLDAQASVAAHRRSAVRELRHNHTLKEISEQTGLSIARISQIELGYDRAERRARGSK